MTAEIHVWKGINTNSTFVDEAVGVLDTSMNYDLGFDVDAYHEDWRADYDDSNDSTWDEVKSGFKNHVLSEYGTPGDNECHAILLDRTVSYLGAGKAWGTIKQGNIWNSSGAAMFGVNVAVDAYITFSLCNGGNGTAAYKNTVIHEAGHTLLDHLWWQSDYPVVADEHSVGEIVSNNVSPMQTWYTYAACDFNQEPDDNCSGNPDAAVSGFQVDLSSCAVSEMNKYANHVGL